jgi:TonB-dependent starch-binding outer membrane protein SusC
MKTAYNILKKAIFLIALTVINLSVFAQGTKITGKVVDSDGQPMPGVNIVLKGSPSGTVTDINGLYSIQVPSTDDVLVFSYIGYVTENVAVKDQKQIDIILLQDLKTLEEVVVIGYGTAKKGDITTSIVGVKGDKLNQETSGNFTNALQGKAAGVQVISNNGAPGAVPKVLIRGFTTINLSTDPLYVVDGIPVVNTDGNSNVNFLSSEDIEDVQVLKDASAAAIYGTRASSGVILITTKRGKTGKTKYNVNFTYGTQMVKKPYDVLNSQDYATALNLSYNNSGLSNLITDVTNLNNTDWWGLGIRKYAPEMSASLTASGGSDTHQYSIGLNYFSQESFYHEGKWQKVTARINNDYKLSKWLSVGADLNPRYEYWDNTPSWYGDYLLIDPITPVFRPADQLTGAENEYSKYMRSIYTYTWNPLARDNRQFAKGQDYALFTNAYIDIHPVKDLVFRSQVGANLVNEIDDDFNPVFTIDASHEFNSTTNMTRNSVTDFNWTWQNTLTYNLKIEKHSASAMIGMTSEEQNRKYVKAYREGTSNTSETSRDIDASNGTVQKAYGNTYRNSIVSYIGRITYNYDERYLFTATLRKDGSSKFLDANKWATFPSASVAWRISNEQFMKKYSFLSDMKIFAGWGCVGNQSLPSDVYLSKLGTDYYVIGSGSGTVVNTTNMSTLKNKDIKWETIEEKNLGVDVAVFNSAISATLEVFQKKTRDMLFQMNYPYYSGFPSWANIWTNIGDMEARGFEASINLKQVIHKFSFDLGLNFSRAKMEMKSLPGVSELYSGETWNSANTTKTVVGDEPGFFFGYKTDGIFQNMVEINSHTSEHGDILQPNARPGDIRFVDTNNDGVLNDKDRVKLGSPYPKFTAGININANYKTDAGDFDFIANIYINYGNKVVNWLKYDKYNAVSQTNLASDALTQAWHGEGTSNDIPIVSHLDLNENYTKFSDFYVEDGSFARLKNIQLGYTLPSKVIQKLRLTKLRFYISGQNLVTLTKFTGIDPEASFTPLKYGFQRWSYPVQRTVLFGVNVSF